MKKNVCIVTLYDDNNYGNRLQNYAVQEIIRQHGCNCESLINVREYDSIKYKIKNFLKFFLKKRFYNFSMFNNNIKFSNIKLDNSKRLSDNKISKLNNRYDYFITGSDQVWNPTLKRFNTLELLFFTDSHKKIAFSASFGISKLPDEYNDLFKNELSSFKYISVRENTGYEIVKAITDRDDTTILVDPTMLLSESEWSKVAKKPKYNINKKFILNYFLGELSDNIHNEIKKVASANNCSIINILDPNDPFYKCGPSEFLWLEKNAFLICTDSFHSSVFSIIFDKPFIIFDREQIGIISMHSRIDTLLSKFKLEDRKYNGRITNELLNHDYSQAYKILEKERIKSNEFLKKALDIKE